MSRRWSYEDYKVALQKQLVGQYMRHNKATTGFLIIVLQEARTWNAPQGGNKLDFEAVLAMLRKKALALEASDRRRYLRVIGIDATKPKDFRAAAKKPNKASLAPRPFKKTAAPARRAVVAKRVAPKVAKTSPAPSMRRL